MPSRYQKSPSLIRSAPKNLLPLPISLLQQMYQIWLYISSQLYTCVINLSCLLFCMTSIYYGCSVLIFLHFFFWVPLWHCGDESDLLSISETLFRAFVSLQFNDIWSIHLSIFIFFCDHTPTVTLYDSDGLAITILKMLIQKLWDMLWAAEANW